MLPDLKSRKKSSRAIQQVIMLYTDGLFHIHKIQNSLRLMQNASEELLRVQSQEVFFERVHWQRLYT